MNYAARVEAKPSAPSGKPGKTDLAARDGKSAGWTVMAGQQASSLGPAVSPSTVPCSSQGRGGRGRAAWEDSHCQAQPEAGGPLEKRPSDHPPGGQEAGTSPAGQRSRPSRPRGQQQLRAKATEPLSRAAALTPLRRHGEQDRGQGPGQETLPHTQGMRTDPHRAKVVRKSEC